MMSQGLSTTIVPFAALSNVVIFRVWPSPGPEIICTQSASFAYAQAAQGQRVPRHPDDLVLLLEQGQKIRQTRELLRKRVQAQRGPEIDEGVTPAKQSKIRKGEYVENERDRNQQQRLLLRRVTPLFLLFRRYPRLSERLPPRKPESLPSRHPEQNAESCISGNSQKILRFAQNGDRVFSSAVIRCVN